MADLSIDSGMHFVNAGALFTDRCDQKLRGYAQEVMKLEEMMSCLTRLQKEIADAPAGQKEVELSEAALALIQQLMEGGIQLLDEEQEVISGERMMHLRSQIESEMSSIKMKEQNIFLKDINPTLTDRQTVLDIIKNVLKQLQELNQRIGSRTGRRD